MNPAKLFRLSVTLGLALFVEAAHSASILINNPGFEDTSGQVASNEFTFGLPVGWDLYDPDNVTSVSGVFIGTLLPNGTDFFTQTAPEGSRVGIMFGSAGFGLGAYGFEQTTGTSLAPNTRYDLSVRIGDIDSGTSTNGTFFDLEEFPGYRLELLAGGQVIAQDNNSFANILIEGEFVDITLSFTTGAAPTQSGNIGIRLINLNEIPVGFTAETSPDLEVDFDDVRLTSTVVVPVPPAFPLMASACLMLAGWCRVGSKSRRKNSVTPV